MLRVSFVPQSLLPFYAEIQQVSSFPVVPPFMMFYHDGLRIIAAENARHSSIISGTPI
ncbi:hypothetical protein C8Q78DRAFT_1030280 [Trametes maxima]|nr:hypothetical protein C8Q78DRAFT_1030280 [Trametes maxima]